MIAADLRPSTVWLDGYCGSAPCTFEAAHVSDYRWNGWAVPYFTLEEARKIDAATRVAYADAGQPDEEWTTWTFGADGIIWENEGPGLDEDSYEVDTIEVDGVTLYNLGNGFTWITGEHTHDADRLAAELAEIDAENARLLGQ